MTEEEQEDLAYMKQAIGCFHILMIFFLVMDAIMTAAFMIWTNKITLFILIVSMILTLSMLIMVNVGVRAYNQKIDRQDR